MCVEVENFRSPGCSRWRAKNAVAKCGVLDWQAKSGQTVTCRSRVIWHAQVQAELNQGCATQCVNAYSCACCIYRSEEAPEPRRCAEEDFPVNACKHALRRRCSGNIVAIQQPYPSGAGMSIEATASVVVAWRRPQRRPPPTPLQRRRPQQLHSRPSSLPLPRS